MNKIFLIAVILFMFSETNAQTVTELYEKKDFKGLVKKADKPDKLTADECYMVGYAFFQMENDDKAIEMYDRAMAKGRRDGAVHFYKGLSLRFQKKLKQAMEEIDSALKYEPTNQEFMNEKGVILYYAGEEDKAMKVFEAAKVLPATYPEPYYWIAYLLHRKEKYEKALEAYYEAAAKMNESNSHYLDVWMSIGQLEYSFTYNYLLSAKAYQKAIQIDDSNYELYYKLIKSFNAAKAYPQADSVFQIVKKAYDRRQLPAEDMEIKSIAIAQFEWNGQVAVIRRSLVEAKEMLDISYKVFLLNKEGDKVVRRFLVEKTLQISKDDAKYLLCEEDRDNKVHYTYPYGWVMDTIPPDSLQEAVVSILEGKMKPSASSRFGR